MDRPAAADYPAGARLPLRVIDDFELVSMLRGRATFVLEDSTEHALASGRLLLIPRGLRHGFHWNPARPSRHGYVHFSPPTSQRRCRTNSGTPGGAGGKRRKP